MTERTLDVVHVGSASRDLTDADPRGWRLGGGATYSALTTARLGLRTGAIVGVDPNAARATELDLLRAAGVNLLLLPLEEGPVFRNRETTAGRVQTCIAAGRPLTVPRLPGRWRRAPVWSLVPVAGELDEDWVSVVPQGAFVGLGWQGLLRSLTAGKEVTRLVPAPTRLLDRADLVALSRHDLAPGTRLGGLLRNLNPNAHLVVTDGPDGGQMLYRAANGIVRKRRYAAIAPDREVDPTGAGDVFLAALVASMVGPVTRRAVRRRPSGFDLRFAATAASFVVEAPGLYGVPGQAAVFGRLARVRAAGATAG